MNDDTARGDGTRDYAALQRDIRDSRERIAETIGALERKFGRLAPRKLMEQTMKRIHTNPGGRTAHSDVGQDRSTHSGYGERAAHGLSSVGGTMRSHPVPLAMIGIGLGWLALASSGYDRKIARSGAMRSARDRAGSAASHARDAFYSATSQVSEAAGHAYERAGSAVSSASESVRDRGTRLTSRVYGGDSATEYGARAEHRTGRSMTSSFWDMVEEHPLIAGVMGMTLGAALGASIPSTRYENRWVGDYADDATERVKDMAQEYMDRGTRAARAAVEAAREEASGAVEAAKDAAREEANKPA